MPRDSIGVVEPERILYWGCTGFDLEEWLGILRALFGLWGTLNALQQQYVLLDKVRRRGLFATMTPPQRRLFSQIWLEQNELYVNNINASLKVLKRDLEHEACINRGDVLTWIRTTQQLINHAMKTGRFGEVIRWVEKSLNTWLNALLLL